MFPELSPQLQITEPEETAHISKSFLFDFEEGDFVLKDGKLQAIEGIEALKVKIEKLLRTEKDKFKVYETYGIVSKDIISSRLPVHFIQAEIERDIINALILYPDVESVGNFDFNRLKRGLEVNFTINTLYGQVQQEVIF